MFLQIAKKKNAILKKTFPDRGNINMKTVVILRENPSKSQMLSVKSQILGSVTELQKVR